ncbi:MAG TPA: hypothetical protein VF600_03240 [Abditibacteriaceae bacterium]|jgi:predicted glycosyltransferase
MRRPRLLFYAVNGLGLGHVTRLLGLARAVRLQSPEAEVLFLTTTEAAHVIYSEGFAALKLPSRAAAAAGRLRHDSWLRLSQTVVWNAISAFDPHCLVVDTFAAGTLQELLPILRWPLRKVFIFRAQRPERAHDPFLQSTLRLYDLILVPHEQDSENVPTPEGVASLWTGPMLLRERSELLQREQARAMLGLAPDAELGLLVLGGGGEPEMQAARTQLREAMAAVQSPIQWIELQGPLTRYDPGEYSSAPAHDSWRTLRDVHPLMIYLRAFDCAIAAAGYNTTHELQAAAVPCALWPFARDVDDQESRVAQLSAAGRVLCIGSGAAENRVPELAAAMRSLADASTRERLRAAMHGASTRNGTHIGAEAILSLLA